MNDIRDTIKQLETLTSGWAVAGELSEIERDLVLEKLRRLYDAVRFVTAAPIAAEEVVAIDLDEVISLDDIEQIPSTATLDSSTPVEAVMVASAAVAVAAAYPEPDYAATPEPMNLSTSEYTPEHEYTEQAEEQAEEEICESAPASEPTLQPVAGSLFGDDEQALHRRKQRVIMSLYDAEPPRVEQPREVVTFAEPTPLEEPFSEEVIVDEPFSEETIADEPFSEISLVSDAPAEVAFETTTGAVLGDVINHGRQTLSDTITPVRDVASELRRREPIEDLRYAVGINDKFLMIRDLFGGESDAYDQALEALNGFDDLDDCMIYIAENYMWNPNCDGAKLLMELLERKYA